MIQVRNETMRNAPHEMTIGDFEKVTTALNDKTDGIIDRYAKVFHILGLSKDLIEDLESDEFNALIREFTDQSKAVPSECVPSIEIDGVKYVAFTDSLKIKVKDMKLIEKFVGIGTSWVAEMMGVLFKKEGLSNIEHYDVNHIKHKAKMFREKVTADVAFPYMMELSGRMVQSLQKETNADKTTTTEGVVRTIDW